ncbi:MAG: M48 family metallopeptidase [Campylobacterota bacterium]
MNFNTSLPDDTVNVSKQSPLLDLLWMSGGLFIGITLLYFTFGLAVEYGVKSISTEREIKLFSFLQSEHNSTEAASAELLTLRTLLNESETCRQSPYDFVVNIVEDETVNAFALPGGTIIFNRGLLKNVHSENELFFVLAHEIGHYKNRDHLEGIGRALTATFIGNMLGVSDISDILNSAMALSESHFSQTQESEADIYAVELMQCYYGHVSGATDFFTHLPENDSFSLYSSHPEMKERTQNIERHIKKNGYTADKDLRPLQTSSPSSMIKPQ